jgi:glycosyltransferase involved in cell wall biosynthesis
VASTHYHGKGHTRLANAIHPAYRVFGGWAVRRAQKVICASEFEQGLVQAHLRVPGDRIALIPDGVSVQAIRSAQRFDFHEPVLLYVGRLEPYKRVDLAIAALEHLPPEFRLCIIGKGPEEEALQRQVREAGLGGRVEFLKNVPNEALYRWYRSASLLVMMSEAESFPMTSIEALAGGCRVVCSAAPPFTGLAREVHEAVFPVPNPDPAGLAARIVEIAGCPGRAAVDLSRYDWDNVAAETLRLFESVVR